MTEAEIERLVLAAQRAGISEIEISHSGFELRVRVGGGAARAEAAFPPPEEGGRTGKCVRSPGVGVFRRRHPVTGLALVASGQAVTAGQPVAYLQAGPVLRAVTTTEDGVIGETLADDGALVGYGSPLLVLS